MRSKVPWKFAILCFFHNNHVYEKWVPPQHRSTFNGTICPISAFGANKSWKQCSEKVPFYYPMGTPFFNNHVYETVLIGHWGTEIVPLGIRYHGLLNSTSMTKTIVWKTRRDPWL